MQDKSTILSITIPTYNRANYLAETLDSFIPEVSPYNIPIYISNNASIDNTVEVVTEYQKKYPNIFLQTNQENVGLDRNCDLAVKMSSSQFCWIFSDDDTILPGVISAILNKIDEGNMLVMVNGTFFNKTMEIAVPRQNWMPRCEDHNYAEGTHDALLDQTCLYAGFIGAMVVNRERWNTINAAKYFGTGFVFMGVAFEYIVGYPSAFIGFPYIKIRDNNASWINQKFRFVNIELPRTLNYLTNYSGSVKQKIGNIKQQYSFKDLLKYNAEDQFTMEQVEMIKRMKLVISKTEMIKFWFMAHIPPTCSRFIIRIIDPKIYRRIQKERILAVKGKENQFI